MIRYIQPVYRPPSEADSLILQATLGCSHNRCLFCHMYRNKDFRVRKWKELRADMDEAALDYPGTRRIFLADGDAFVLSAGRLLKILEYLSERFPRLERVTCYANPENLLNKTVREMAEIRERGLKIIYYGVESGDPELLKKVNKGASPDQMAEGCRKASEAGIKLSVTVILGLGGRKGSERHAKKTAELINRINPRFLSALTLMTGPHGDNFAQCMGEDFEFNDSIDNVRELRSLIAGLEVDRCIFRSNHASNYLSLGGTLKKSKDKLLAEIDSALKNPGICFRDEWMRGL
ncbi:MAG: radical SAM protein [Candidatus Krumholzibacteriales bacterium]